jgi:hypothetical protein
MPDNTLTVPILQIREDREHGLVRASVAVRGKVVAEISTLHITAAQQTDVFNMWKDMLTLHVTHFLTDVLGMEVSS